MNTENVGARILSEHKNLRALLRKVERSVQQPAGSDAWMENLRRTLSDLVDLCAEHFRLEEQAGLHVQLRDQSPRLAFRLQKLLAEHSGILDTLEKLVTELPAQAVTSRDVEPLKQSVSVALEAVRQHERAENEVMMDAYWEDIGGEAG